MMGDRLERKKETTRNALLRAAKRLYAQHGLYGVSIEDITSEADLGKGTFYNHFKSREELIAAVLQEGLDKLITSFGKESPDDSASPAASSRILFQRHLQFFREHPENLLVFHQARGWLKMAKPDGNPIRQEFKRYVDAIAEFLPVSTEGGFGREPPRQTLARFLAGAIAGALSYDFILGENSGPLFPDAIEFENLFQRLSPVSNRLDEQQPAVPAKRDAAPEVVESSFYAISDLSDWNQERFVAIAEEWRSLLSAASSIEDARQQLLNRVNQRHFETYSDGNETHESDRVIVRDCARAWRGLLHSRSERLSGFSVLTTMVDAAQGVRRSNLSPAFWAELGHLVYGIEGRVRLHGGDSLALSASLAGREAALVRSAELDRLGAVMSDWMARYEDGLSAEAANRRAARRHAILSRLAGEEEEWRDWRWQLRHIARDAEGLGGMACLTQDERKRIDTARQRGIPFGVTPYYASLFDEDPGAGRDHAIRAQVVPPQYYLDSFKRRRGVEDFMGEMDTSPVDLITRRYVAIAILKPFNTCPQICVYCQRNWEINEPLEKGSLAAKGKIKEAIDWLSEHPAIHEVLVTGGDPLILSDGRLKSILDQVASLPHVERIRVGTRTPVTLPMRITPALARLLGSYRIPGRREICLVTHVEHPYEATPEMVRAVSLLRTHGVPVYNQLVYTFYVSRRFEAAALRRLLRRCGIDPYYTFYPKGKEETADYRVPLARMLQEQKEEARLLPGLARTDEAVYNVPRLGKNYLNSWQHRDLISLRPNGARVYEFHPWEKKITPQDTYVGDDAPILDYLMRLQSIGEKPEEYESIWYYF
ncbi:MAG: KamA family radical SAM protein [Myxococcales bacterium]|nr:MAG: KamA family radical SAM protein [Myxococcales bacterium]